MGDISSCLPIESRTVTAIYANLKRVGDAEPPRTYLGASIIGEKCDRALWYVFNDCMREDFPGRLYRLFETGHLQEARMVKELRDTGVTVHDLNDDGEQFGFVDISGHFRGHLDGCGLGVLEAPKTWHLLEFKTHNKKYYAALKKRGVKVEHPKHYAQCQIYMHKTGMKRTLYMAVNKDTDELYTERFNYDRKYAVNMTERARRIITARQPPERCADKPGTFACKFCSAADLCWGTSKKALPVPYISCRQCCHATPEMDTDHGRWSCNFHNNTISNEKRFQACPNHLVIPDLISFAKPTDATNESIEFTNSDGSIWTHGCGCGNWNTKELMACSPESMNKKTEEVKEAFPGSKVVYGGTPTDNILDRYSVDECRQVWSGPATEINKAWEKEYNESLPNTNPSASQTTEEYMVKEVKGHRVAIIVIADKSALILEKAPF